jgi:CubicO group peptidase (beta-lactamase class C family)
MHFWRLGFASILLASGVASAGSPLSPDGAFLPIRTKAEAAVAERALPSIAIIALRDGGIAWTHVAGWADVEQKTRATPDTVYRIGSVSKSITGTLAMIAAKRGEIDLARPVTDYLPWAADRSAGRFRTLPLAALLNMSAGMVQAVHYRGMPGGFTDLDPERFVRNYALAPNSGDQHAYSNMGPELVARAIAASARRDFAAYAQDNLFAPLGMRRTYASVTNPTAQLARSYRRNLTPYDAPYDTDPLAGAGFLASPADLARFAQFHLTGRTERGAELLSRQQIDALHTPPANRFYAFGWGKIGPVLMSDGQVNGGQAAIVLVPSRNIGVVAVANNANDVVTQLALATLDIMAPGAALAFEQAAGALEKEQENKFARRYPPKAPWTARGTVVIDGAMHPLETAATATGMSIRVAGQTLNAQAPESGEGFTRWKFACIAILPACIDGTAADATLILAREGNGYAGTITVDSRLGLFPYEVRLQPGPK